MKRPTPDHEGLQASPRAPELAPQVARDGAPLEVVDEAVQRGQKLPIPQSESDSDFHKIKVHEPWRHSAAFAEVAQPQEKQPQSLWRRRRKVIVAGVLAAVVVVVAVIAAVVVVVAVIAVVVALVVTRKNSGTQQSNPSPTPAPASTSTFSTSGAFNGSGLGSLGGIEPSYVYFQHFDGDIWEATVSSGDTNVAILHGDIRNGTPISAETYTAGSDSVKQVVYVDSHNILQDIREVNGSGTWNPGSLGDAKFQVSSSPTAGLDMIAQYGSQSDSSSSSDKTLDSVKVYYGGTDGLIHEVSQDQGLTGNQWKETFVFPNNMNGHGGFTTLQPLAQPMKHSYLHCSDTNGVLSWFSKETYPAAVGDWMQGASSSVNVLANSSFGMIYSSNLVIFQDPSAVVRAVSWNASDSDHPFGTAQELGPALPRTHIVARYNDNRPTAWVQTKGNDVTRFEQDTGRWEMSLQNVS